MTSRACDCSNACIYNMDNLIEIQFDYTYYLKKRKTPSFIDNNELLALSYDDFYSRVLSEVPHITKHLLSPIPVHAITKKIHVLLVSCIQIKQRAEGRNNLAEF